MEKEATDCEKADMEFVAALQSDSMRRDRKTEWLKTNLNSAEQHIQVLLLYSICDAAGLRSSWHVASC